MSGAMYWVALALGHCTDQIKSNLSFDAISFFSTVENQIASSHKALLAMTINIVQNYTRLKT